jgi:hypothetical protein
MADATKRIEITCPPKADIAPGVQDGEGNTFQHGDVVEVSPEIAAVLIKNGQAKEVAGGKKAAEKV